MLEHRTPNAFISLEMFSRHYLSHKQRTSLGVPGILAKSVNTRVIRVARGLLSCQQTNHLNNCSDSLTDNHRLRRLHRKHSRFFFLRALCALSSCPCVNRGHPLHPCHPRAIPSQASYPLLGGKGERLTASRKESQFTTHGKGASRSAGKNGR